MWSRSESESESELVLVRDCSRVARRVRRGWSSRARARSVLVDWRRGLVGGRRWNLVGR